MYTITQLGPNSYTLGCDAREDVLPAIRDLIANYTTGWEEYDSEDNGMSANQGAVFRSLCADGLTYKYLHTLDPTAYSYVYAHVYESWNNVTHVGVNQTYGSNRTGLLFNANRSNFYLHVFISPRWFAYCGEDPTQTVLNGAGGNQGIYGCFEIARDNPGNVVASGELPYAYFHTANMTNESATATTTYGMLCKSRVGSSNGQNAQTHCTYLFGGLRGQFQDWKGSRNAPTAPDPFTGEHWALDIYHHVGIPTGAADFEGRVYGLKMTTRDPSLQFLDIMSVDVDADNFTDPVTGTPVDHYVLISSTNNSEVDDTLSCRMLIPR